MIFYYWTKYEVKLKILEDLQQQLTMLKNKRESLSHVPMKRLKENLEYYDELIRKIEKSIKELEKEIKGPFDENLCT